MVSDLHRLPEPVTSCADFSEARGSPGVAQLAPSPATGAVVTPFLPGRDSGRAGVRGVCIGTSVDETTFSEMQAPEGWLTLDYLSDRGAGPRIPGCELLTLGLGSGSARRCTRPGHSFQASDD